MKKLLVASTAIVAVAAVSSANAADPIKLSVGGYMNQYVGYVSQDDDLQEDFAEVNINSETELYFRGSTTLDNGLTVSVNIDRYADRDDAGGDDVFLQISSDSMGRLRIGQTKGAAYALSHSAPNVAIGNNDGDVSDWIARPTQTAKRMNAGSDGDNRETYVYSDQTMTASEGNDGQKIVYWTPNLGGFQAGFSYGLDVNNTAIEGPVNVGGNNTNADTAWDAGIAYNGDFGGVSFGADVTYQQNNNGGTTGPDFEDRESYRAGVSVGVAGFTVGGSYRKTKNERSIKDVDSSGWDLGVSYETGPYGVSLSYASFEEDAAANSALEDTAKTWVLGASYDLGAGVTLVGSVFSAEYDAADSSLPTTADNEGTGIVTGLQVSF
ncbi:porin [Terasakiella pusilla]|uniref:porin n=1 Tax=Terasakiella pusilla TaxID=64973 RepID=UPI00048FB1B3|nr:porin [Terasakiella pusilla]